MKLLPVLGSLLWSMAWAQTPPAPPPTPPQQQTPANPSAEEMNTREESAASFKAHVNLVMVPVVARDVHGVAIGNLTKENFQLFDKGKPQDITRFSVEKVGAKAPLEANATPGIPLSSEEGRGHMVAIPERFVVYLFDDVHLAMGDLTLIREAAERSIAELRPTDRAAIFTMSGNPMLDFTDDKAQLHDALYRLRHEAFAAVGGMATVGGLGVEAQTFASLGVLKDIIRRLSGAPGQRTLMIVSPGFYTQDPLYFGDKNDILDKAIRANVIINAMDARGLYTDPALDASRPGNRRLGVGLMAESMRADVLAELASGTGGTFFQNSNSYDEGFKRLAAAPEYVYLLGFSPQNLKNDGSFHSLRVSIKPSGNLTLQVRRGYYAPKKLDDAEETARQEIEAALFSREEIKELPIDMHTQFFKADNNAAKLALLVRLNLKLFKYRKVDGRNNNSVAIVMGIFDRNGHYMQGIKKVLELKLKDETLANRLGQGITVRTGFDVTPGTYVIRLVVRDTEGQLLSATNGAVEIP